MIARPQSDAGQVERATRSRLAGAALAAALLSLGLVEPVRALPVPDSSQMLALHSAIDGGRPVRVRGHNAYWHVARPPLDASGIALTREQAYPALIPLGDPSEPVRRLSWSEIEGIDVGERHVTRGILTGLVVGAAVGSLIVRTYGPDIAEDGDHVLVALGGILAVGGGTLGLVVGSSPHWRPIYP